MNDGDFVKIEFVGKVKATGEIFDLTDENLAKNENIYDAKKKYGPVLIIVGKNMVIPGVEKQIKGMKVGEEKEFTVKPKDAFGDRDFKKIKIVSYSKFKKNKVEPVPGLYVDIDGKEAKVQSVSGGRVRIDFNHPLAGKELSYRLKIVEKIDDTESKCRGIVEKYGMNVIVKDAKMQEDGKLRVVIEKDVPSSVKDVIEKQITKYVPEVKTVIFELKPLPEKPSKKRAESAASANKSPVSTGTTKA
ncbi:MAG: peptidylprolyl isomerase [Candidatus Micrarchaeota archaeon]|nr:peptidylprolyl isomerase [Candidatus Micrarchaeota archaeon]